MKKFLIILIPILILAAGFFIWVSFFRTPELVDVEVETPDGKTFSPFGRTDVPSSQGTGGITPVPASSSITEAPLITGEGEIPRLRQLSATPVGGFMASTTASTTLARYIDRGTGHVYEVKTDSHDIVKISNTTIPRVYESVWNKNGNLAVFQYVKDEEGTIANFFAELRAIKPNASSTETTMPFEIKGKFLSNTIKEAAVSPRGDRIFTFIAENGVGAGYISNFDESKKTEVITTPLTQVNIAWPQDTTVAIATKASGTALGHLYLIDLKKPFLNKVVGNVVGLTAKVSPDAKRVLYSSGGSRFGTTLLNLQDNSTQEVLFRTIADKCVWSKLHPAEAYCAVPTEVPTGTYPDDWYKGVVSFVDQIWHLDGVTGEVTLVANPLTLGDVLMDATSLTLDPRENFLYFINKRDLTLWSLDLNE